jgi:orotidine-5'-phosphate decarboxylase
VIPLADFRSKLLAAARRNRSWLCVGLDPDPALVPVELLEQPGWVETFNRGLIEATSDLVCAYKPNLAFYEALGLEGWEGLHRTLAAIPPDIPIIADGKRGDIGSTSDAYARALFEELRVDAATLAPYIGLDGLEPFLRYHDRGLLILCKTSNPGSADFQDLEVSWRGQTMPLYQAVARRVVEWNSQGNCGLVVGATYPEQLGVVRTLAPDLPILIPGVGAQEGDLEAALQQGADGRGEMAIVNVSRGIAYADRGERWREAAREAAERIVRTMRQRRPDRAAT